MKQLQEQTARLTLTWSTWPEYVSLTGFGAKQILLKSLWPC